MGMANLSIRRCRNLYRSADLSQLHASEVFRHPCLCTVTPLRLRLCHVFGMIFRMLATSPSLNFKKTLQGLQRPGPGVPSLQRGTVVLLRRSPQESLLFPESRDGAPSQVRGSTGRHRAGLPRCPQTPPADRISRLQDSLSL